LENGRQSRATAWRDSIILAVGAGVSGLAAYAYIVIGTRSFGDDFAPVSALWTFWFMSAAIFTFPVMHWVIRTMAADGSEGRVRNAIPLILLAAIAVSALFGGVSWFTRERLFHHDGLVFPLLTASIPFGSVAMGLTRGSLAGRGRFIATAAAIAGENLIRVVVAALVAAAGGGIEVFGLGILLGFLIALGWPSSMVFRGELPATRDMPPLAFVGTVAGGTLLAQIVLAGGPVLLAGQGGTEAEINAVFSSLAIFRAPYMVATGVATYITGALTRLVMSERHDQLRRLRWGTMLACAAGIPAAGAFGWYAGPGFLRLVFGPDIRMSGDMVAVVAAGSLVALAGLFYTLLLVAGTRVAVVPTAWGAAFAVWIVWCLVGPGNVLVRAVWGFFAAEVVSLVIMLGAPIERLHHPSQEVFAGGSESREQRAADAGGADPQRS
jgi:O-antigen/teichoic acid export membrane protein